MKKTDLKLNLKFLHYVRNQVFNISTVKDHPNCGYVDPVTKKYVLDGSASNVKHCIEAYFKDLCENEAYKREFAYEKKFEEKNGRYTAKQGGVSTVNMLSIGSAIFGAWNSDGSTNDKEAKSKLGGRISSVLNIGGFSPVHGNLVTRREDGGVHSCTGSSTVKYTYKGETFGSIEEFAEKKHVSLDAFDNLDDRTMNIYGDNMSKTTGLYFNDIVVDLSKFGIIDLREFSESNVLNDMIQHMCHEFGCKVVDGKYLVYPEEIVLECWEMLVESIFSWDFTSHRSLHGDQINHLRVSYSFGKADVLNNSITIKMTDDKTIMCLNDKLVEEYGVKTYNAKLLEGYYDVVDDATDLKTSVNAIEDAMYAVLNEGREKIRKNITELLSK